MKIKYTNPLNAFLFIVFFASLHLSSQELDEAYLESLPDDIREGVLDQIDETKESEQIKYKKKSSSKLKKAQDEEKEESDRFGMKIFTMMQSSFMPINEPNLDGSYIIDYGDVIELQLVGGKNNTIETLTVNRDGSINIPEIGKINVSGLSLESVSNLVKSKFQTTLLGVEAFISLGSMRDIQVLIAGNAFNPGIYTLSGGSNALHALSMAGGITDDGSFREIKISRNGKAIAILDLYDIFIFGKTSYGPRLRSGDSILVAPYKKLVNINGGVNRPAVYEVKDTETAKDLLNFANGFSYNANKEYISYEKLDKNKITSKIISDKDFPKINLNSGDSIFIGAYSYKKATITGGVNLPGTYIIQDGDKLSDIIIRAGGYKENAYPYAGILENKRALETQKIAQDALYTKYVESMVTTLSLTPNSSGGVDALKLILNQIKNAPITGRVIAEFDLDALAAVPKDDVILEDGDKISVPYITQQVYVFGEVNTNGASRYESNKDIHYYIDSVGGVTKNADSKNIFIVQPNGKTIALRNSGGRLSIISGNGGSINVFPGSVIYVPRDASLKDPTAIASIWAPIVSSLAVTLTSLSLISSD